jgi:hypothetical protein
MLLNGKKQKLFSLPSYSYLFVFLPSCLMWFCLFSVHSCLVCLRAVWPSSRPAFLLSVSVLCLPSFLPSTRPNVFLSDVLHSCPPAFLSVSSPVYLFAYILCPSICLLAMLALDRLSVARTSCTSTFRPPFLSFCHLAFQPVFLPAFLLVCLRFCLPFCLAFCLLPYLSLCQHALLLSNNEIKLYLCR